MLLYDKILKLTNGADIQFPGIFLPVIIHKEIMQMTNAQAIYHFGKVGHKLLKECQS